MSAALRIAGSGMCCAVGFSAPAARAAIRAGLDAFMESEFRDERGQRVIVASLPLGDVWGPRRIAAMFSSALAECAAGAAGFAPATTALLLLVAERGRPGTSDTWAAACLRACEEAAGGGAFHPASRVMPLGRAGLGEALEAARALLEARSVERVIVGGADSYLNAHAMNRLLRRGRVLASDASDGFIPGEGAGALLVELAPPGAPGVRVLGVGAAEEAVTIDSDDPQRAVGLTRAIRGALAQSGYRMSDMHFRMGDMTGETYYFREAGIAASRALDQRAPHMPLLHITDAVGETGAAIGPLSLAYLAGALPRGHAPGSRGLVHLASDGGARAAVVVEYLAA